jgi:excisionase family DNA binding protein
MVLLNIPATAVALGISVAGVFRLLRSGELDRVKVGRGTRVPQESIDAYLARNTTAAQVVADAAAPAGD